MTLAWASPFNKRVNVIMNQNKATGVCPVNVRRSNKGGSVYTANQLMNWVIAGGWLDVI